MSSESPEKEIARELYRRRLLRTWLRDKPEGWRLISGLWSPFYIQLRPLPSHPDLLLSVGEAMTRMILSRAPQTTHLVGIAMAGIPIAVATSLASGMPCSMTRKLEGVRSLADLEKTLQCYGEHALLEGEICDGDHLLLVDDMVTRFDSKLVAAAQVRAEVERRGLSRVKCEEVAVVLDREQGAAEAAAQHSMRLHALIPFRSQGLAWLADVMSPRELEVISDYLANPQKYQEPAVQQSLRDMHAA